MNTKLDVRDTEVKTVGRSGQISLGKRYAGKTLRMERFKDGRIVLTPVAMVPESQHWTLQEPDRSRIERGLDWAAQTASAETNIDHLAMRVTRRAARSRGRRA
jgi:hypothetical protein